MSFKRLLFSVGSLALALAAAPEARAQVCGTTADCHRGFECVFAPSPPTPTTPACTSSAPCPVADPAPSMNLLPRSSGSCEPAPCAADTECGPNMVCHTETFTACNASTAVACAPNTVCAKPAPVDPVCTETKISRCTFTWQLPCSADTDCGAGFNCIPSVTATCSGSGGTGSGTVSSDGGAAPPSDAGAKPSTGAAAAIAVPVPVLPPDTCMTMTTFPGSCQPKATTCIVSTDCPTDWTCMAAPPTRSGGTAGSGVATGMGTASAGASGTTAVPPTTGGPAPAPAMDVAPPAMICGSPYGTTAPKANDGGGTTTVGGGAGGTTTVGGGAGGTTGTGSHMGAGGSGTPPTETSASPGNSGCAVAGDSSGSALGLLALGLVGMLSARRRR